MTRNDFLQKRLWILLCWPVAGLLTIIAAKNPQFAEWYATHFYAAVSQAGNRLTSLAPFSVAELLLFLLLAAAPFLLVHWGIKLYRSSKRLLFLYRTVLNLFCTVGIFSLLFTTLCGINYSRLPFAQVSGLTVKNSSTEELKALCNHLAQKANVLRDQVRVDQNQVMGLSAGSFQPNAQTAQKAYEIAEKKYPTLFSGYRAPKPVLTSRLMSAGNITGISIPFTFEANVNTDIPAFSIPFTMGHELAHLRGYMREDEANFIGYLICKQSKDTDFQYSGTMMALIHASNALYAADANAGDALFKTLNPGVLRDLNANNTYWQQFEGPVSKVANSVNDTYLKANRQQDGIKSYGRMVDLLLAEYNAEQKNAS